MVEECGILYISKAFYLRIQSFDFLHKSGSFGIFDVPKLVNRGEGAKIDRDYNGEGRRHQSSLGFLGQLLYDLDNWNMVFSFLLCELGLDIAEHTQKLPAGFV